MRTFRRQLLILAVKNEPIEHTFNILVDDEYVGKFFYCISNYDDERVFGTWSITSGNEYATINENGRVDIIPGTVNRSITIRCTYDDGETTLTAVKSMIVSYENDFTIECANDLSGTSANVMSRYNAEVVNPVWSIISGSSYAQIDSGGTITILGTGPVTIQADYNYETKTKDVNVYYTTSSSSSTEISEDGAVTTTTTTVVVNPDGSTTETITSTTTNIDGYVINVESGTTTNQDGSSTTTATTTNQDGSGSHSVVNVETDGSSSGNTTNYNENGDPTSATNNVVDTQGNSSTQDLVYDESGNSVVTGYEIDTSGNPEGGKQFNGDGVNTEYYAFDMTHGFILDFDFTINFTNQPPGQHENHHNILTMKRATPEPWYGFQLRQTSTNKYIILGTQFSTGSNTNTTISPSATTGDVEYNIRIIYDPTSSGTTFICKNMATDTNIFTSNKVFPDIEALKYLKVTIGYAMNENGDPYRYSNINVKNFSIRRLTKVADPVIECDGMQVSISCETEDSTIYYRLNHLGNFSEYTGPISITADTVVEAYSELDGEVSNTITKNCIYDNGIEKPVIDCDGEIVTINCDTPSVDIYYRLNQSGQFEVYTDAIEITADTIVEAYAYLNGETSSIVLKNCVYSPFVITEPVITCNGSRVTITCATQDVTIYYRLDQTGSFVAYESPISITADTVVEAYSKHGAHVSQVVMENCIYDPVHDYSQDYLTLRVLTSGTIPWNSIGTGQSKTIEYSINNGTWTSITASSSELISVSANDVVRLRGTNASYAKDKNNYSGFEGGTATYDIEGNIMSLVYGDNFIGNNTLTGTYNFCSMFKLSNAVSAENMVLPATTLTNYCYRAMFSKAASLVTPPELPATTLAQGVYWYMFEECPMTTAPDLLATELVSECYGYMFTNCRSLNYIKCLATTGFSTYRCLQGWVTNVASSGTFVKDVDTPIATGSWTRGNSGIPTSWLVYDNMAVAAPDVLYDGFDTVTITCSTQNADIYYKVDRSGEYALYSAPITISADTYVESYAEFGGQTSRVTNMNCPYVSDVPLEASNRDLTSWKYNNQNVTTPYSVNAIDGHSSSYAKGTFNFETSFALRDVNPTYLWFQHADQSAAVYLDDTLVEKHWGGYNSFFIDLSEHVHSGSNSVKVAIKNNEGNNLAPAAGDFNLNATLGNVKLFTSPVVPDTSYGYDGFHVKSTVSDASATINVLTSIPTGATVVCTIDDGTYHWTDTKPSTGEEMIFSTTITNPHLWNGKIDPHLYTITLDVYYGGDLYHTYSRGYGLRYYEYVIDDTVKVGTAQNPYTGFLLNGSPYLLRGVCMHHDLDGRANALTAADVANDFDLISELGCNFLRLAHYPHPKEVYDWCDQLGIIVQTEAPCVNKLQSTMPTDYYTHLEDQYTEMVNEHYNHPSIIFWGLSNETTTDDKEFGKTKIEAYTTLIKTLDPSRLVGYVMSHSYPDPSAYYNNPNVDWFGCNIYVGWYIDKTSNDPTSQLNTRVRNIITNKQKALAFSEYGAGGTQNCHSEDPQTTTTKGNYERHDIEYQMWLHEGHIVSVRNFPQLLFTSEWQLFDIAVSNRNEGYTVCLDGETTSINDDLRRLNDKGLVERDHVTKKDTFYIYKAEWSSENFVHICGKDYTRKTDRVIKCYTNDGTSMSMYVNGTIAETVTATDHIAMFTSRNFSSGDTVMVSGATASDTFTFA